MRMKKESIVNTPQSDKKDTSFGNYLVFHENKNQLFYTDKPLLVMHYLYLKAGGNPYMAINLMETLINAQLLQIDSNKAIAIISPRLLIMVDNEEMLEVEAPLCRTQVNGPIIDKLSCFEQLLLKAASVIGDIFDIQTLSRILPFKGSINQEKLIQILNILYQKDIIELMNITEYNTYYRFSHSFMRECIYQRMTYSQRRQIHLNVAEAIQMMPTIYETEEEMEAKKLEYHWNMAEQKWSLKKEDAQLDQKMDENYIQKDGRQQICSNIIEFRQISHKALRSIIVKQIQNKLAKSFNDQSTIIKAGYLVKKSDSNITWADRYCVMDSKEFRYSYIKQDAESKTNLPLCSILLKNIYSILPMSEQEVSRSFVFQLSCSSWTKRNKDMGLRKFYFAANNEESLEQWTIFIEFARAKAIYDEFVNSFGKIQFPIGSQIDCFDMAFKNDVHMKKKIASTVSKQNQDAKTNQNERSASKMVIAARNSRSSRFQALKIKQNSSNNQDEIRDNKQLEINNKEVLELLTKRLKKFLDKSTLLLFSHLFEMSIQKQEGYRIFGQSNYAVKKMNNFFKIEKELTERQAIEMNRASQAHLAPREKEQSNSQQNQPQQRKTVKAIAIPNQQVSELQSINEVSEPNNSKRNSLQNLDHGQTIEEEEEYQDQEDQFGVLLKKTSNQSEQDGFEEFSPRNKMSEPLPEIKKEFTIQPKLPEQKKPILFQPNFLRSSQKVKTSPPMVMADDEQIGQIGQKRASLKGFTPFQEEKELPQRISSKKLSDESEYEEVKREVKLTLQKDEQVGINLILSDSNIEMKSSYKNSQRHSIQRKENHHQSSEHLYEQPSHQYRNLEISQDQQFDYDQIHKTSPSHVKTDPSLIQEIPRNNQKLKQSVKTPPTIANENFKQPFIPTVSLIKGKSEKSQIALENESKVAISQLIKSSIETQTDPFNYEWQKNQQHWQEQLQGSVYDQQLRQPPQMFHPPPNMYPVFPAQLMPNYSQYVVPSPLLQPILQGSVSSIQKSKSRSKSRKNSPNPKKTHKLKKSNIPSIQSKHTISLRFFKEEQFGIATKHCVSLKGDKFTLEKGVKVVIRKVHRSKGYVECSLDGKNGIFSLDYIKIEKEGFKIYSSQLESPKKNLNEEDQFEYSQLVNSHFNLRDSNLNFNKSTTGKPF